MSRKYTRRKNSSSRRNKKRNMPKGVHMGGNKELICAKALKNICKYNLDSRYGDIPFDNNLKEGDLVFLTVADITEKFVKLPPSKKVSLVVGNSDDTFDNNLMDMVRNYVIKVYAQNASANGVIQNPIGFRDDYLTPHSVLYDVLNDSKYISTKNILCLVNFLVGSNDVERGVARDYFKDKQWANMSNKYLNYDFTKSLQYSDPNIKSMRLDFYKQLKMTKFVICPPGAGVDTHRVYETLFFGCIPVIKTSFLDPMYRRLGGCWIVNDWNEVTEEECNNRWNNKKDAKIKLYASDWLE